MTSLETLALILAILVLVKLTIVIWNPHAWFRIAEAFWVNPRITTATYLILAAIVGTLVLTELSVVEVGASMLFVSLLIGASMGPYSQRLLQEFKTQLESRSEIISKWWISIGIWGGISIWILYEVLIS